MVGFAILFLILQVLRFPRAHNQLALEDRMTKWEEAKKIERPLWIVELLIGIGMVICVAILFILYYHYIPSDSPGCLPYLSPFGVVASNVDPSKYVMLPKTTSIAVTYSQAIEAYKNSRNAYATGIFAWDGAVVTILDSAAVQLAAPGAPIGTSWVFEDLNTAVSRNR